MLRPDLSRIDPEDEKFRNPFESTQSGSKERDTSPKGSIDIQSELNRLEEIVLDSPRIPFTGRTLVDEEELLEQLDLVRLNLPGAFREAEAIVYHKEEILVQAEQYAQEIVEEAEQRAAYILDQLGIIARAELEAKQIRKRVQEECAALQEQTLSDIEEMREQAQQDIEQMRSLAMAEFEEIQNGADQYADRVLKNIEQQLNDMLMIIRNGRQQLHDDTEVLPKQDKDPKISSSNRTSKNPKN
ncbi:MAG: DivIVA domain-containing protein [Crinalium sp.]